MPQFQRNCVYLRKNFSYESIFIRNILFVVIGILAFVRSFALQAKSYALAPDYFIDELQFFGFVMLAIGGCGIYRYLAADKYAPEKDDKPRHSRTPETKEEVERWLSEGK